MLIDQLALDPKRHRPIVDDLSQNGSSRFKGVPMTKKSCMLVEDRLEEHVPFTEFCLPSLPDFKTNLTPHVGDKDNILEETFATELPKNAEIASGNTAHPEVEIGR